MKKLKYWFTLWQLRNYPASMLVPNWYQNLSFLWSKKERNLQAGVARTHEQIGDSLVNPTDDDVDWGDDVVELSIEGGMVGMQDTLYISLKPRPMSWQDKLYQETGIIL